jgi:hypothetical protein
MNKYLEKIAANRLGREAFKSLQKSTFGELSLLEKHLPKKVRITRDSNVKKAPSLIDRVKHYARDMKGYGGEFVEKRAEQE